MRSIVLAMSIALAATALPAPASARDREFVPASAWQVARAPEYCRLVRAFAEGDEVVTFYLTQFQPGSSISALLVGEPFRRIRTDEKVRLQFSPVYEEFERSYDVVTVGDNVPGFMFTSLPTGPVTMMTEEEAEAALAEARNRPLEFPAYDVETVDGVESLSIRWRGSEKIVLPMEYLKDAVGLLNRCTRELVDSWGFDLEAHQVLTRRVELTNGGDIGRNINYPVNPMRRGYESTVRFRTIVAADGSIEDCIVQAETIPKDFGAEVCRAVREKAEFLPALDRTGTPIRSYYTTLVRFQLP